MRAWSIESFAYPLCYVACLYCVSSFFLPRAVAPEGINREGDYNYMAGNRGVAYMGPGKVEVQPIDYPELALGSRKCEHGVILKIVTTNICGSDQHMVRGRTTAPQGLILGHEITGEVIETGRDVEFIHDGDLVSVPFNIACGRCRNCKEGRTGICLNVNPARPGAAYGYVDMGGWVGGQAEYVMVPYADFNLLKFPNRDQAMAKIQDLTLLSDIFPTGYHGAVTAGVGPGSIVYVAGAGPVGLGCAAACQLLGAAVVIVGDMIPERLAQAKSFGCEVIDLKKQASLGEQIDQIVGVPEVDSAVDCVGFEARGHGADSTREQPATVLNSLMTITRAGGALGIPGLYVTDDPGGVDDNAKTGTLGIRIGLGWAKSHTFATGQCPVMRYHRQLMQAILHDKVQVAKAVNVTVIPLDQAPQGYKDFDKGAAKKFVIDPHGIVAKAA
jgi:glutathione-independent formaldehyde dehydrogenase